MCIGRLAQVRKCARSTGARAHVRTVHRSTFSPAFIPVSSQSFVKFEWNRSFLDPPCVNPLKWVALATHVMRFLGHIIDSRQMIVLWPLEKRDRMREFINNVLENQPPNSKHGSTPTDIARVLGLIRHGSFVAPVIGCFLCSSPAVLLKRHCPSG